MAINKRDLLKGGLGVLAAGPIAGAARANSGNPLESVNDFPKQSGSFFGNGWDSLSPGAWRVERGALAPRFPTRGAYAERDGVWNLVFPHHVQDGVLSRFGVPSIEAVENGPHLGSGDPSRGLAFLWRADRRVGRDFSCSVKLDLQGKGAPQDIEPDASWRMMQEGYGAVGLCLGAASMLEYGGPGNAIVFAGWRDDGAFGLYGIPDKATSFSAMTARELDPLSDESASILNADIDAKLTLELKITPEGENVSRISLTAGSADVSQTVSAVVPAQRIEGTYFGLARRGLLDFRVNEFRVEKAGVVARQIGTCECVTCYPLGDTLRKADDRWRTRFVALFKSPGETAEIRIAREEKPVGGWRAQPIAGSAAIISNDFRHNTAIIDVELPMSPADGPMYFTIWKDGVNVTSDGRIGSGGVGDGTGFMGVVPGNGRYVGRLPQLRAPYRVCGMSCHYILARETTAQKGAHKDAVKGGAMQIHDQPSEQAFQHFDDFDFQVLLWEDDIWYLERPFAPLATEDAYKIISHSIAGPTSRWQMMRHWNVMNPGDHDIGIDDWRGAEQVAIRNKEALSGDAHYYRRNLQINLHLMTGDENPSDTDNPKLWRAWTMPNDDMALVVLDGRMWRSVSETRMWSRHGWGHDENAYERQNELRSLLGEEQFAWLSKLVSSHHAPGVLITGLSALHTVWGGRFDGTVSGLKFEEQYRELHDEGDYVPYDKRSSDYVGWYTAGANRVLEAISRRSGIVTVYGDVHQSVILKSDVQRVLEASFGPVGNSSYGGRPIIKGFGPRMKDVDGRALSALALYHSDYDGPDLSPRPDEQYGNFLEIEFKPERNKGRVRLAIRRLDDSPASSPRGGAAVTEDYDALGRVASSAISVSGLPPQAKVVVTRMSGDRVRGAISDEKGNVKELPLVDVGRGERVLVTAWRNAETTSKFVITE